MTTRAQFRYLVRMDVEPAKEAGFNRVYDTEHISASSPIASP
ncbi:MAG TPA: hypothetical protein VKZ50_13895 [bacterium]|nr:hypothetical protein [bacterium]